MLPQLFSAVEDVLINTNGLLYFWQKLKILLGGKVDKVEGKGLSANDYTAADKAKLAGIAEGANNYVHPTTSGSKHIPAGGKTGPVLKNTVDGTAAWADEKDTTYGPMKGSTASAAGTAGLAPAPAAGAATRFLRSDGTWATPPDTNTTYGLATSSADGLMAKADKAKLDAFGQASSYATQMYVAQQVAAAGHIKKSIVSALPQAASADGNTIYMVSKAAGDAGNGYDEYMVISGAWEKIGDTQTTLTFATNADIDAILAS